MDKYLKKIPLKLKEILCQAQKVSGQIRMPAYLVGGCLRDLILGVKNFDLDITVEGDGIIFAQALAKKLSTRKYPAKLIKLVVHERFRTATLILGNGLKVDVATCRREEYPDPGALPVVVAGSFQEDLKRRDFTINALALNLVAEKKQKIIDPFAGQDDLSSGRVRILHALSFQDDPTRILRAVRFSQRFNFKIEPKTLALLKAAISKGLLDKVNPHRLRDELILILKEKEPFAPLKQLDNLRALSFISPKLKIGETASGLFKSVAKEIAGFVKNFPARRKLDIWLIYFMALLEPLTLSQIKMIVCRLGLCKGDQKRVIGYYQERGKVISALSKKQVAPQGIFSLLEPLSYEMIVLLGVVSKNKNLKKHLKAFLKIYHGMRLCVSGDDLKDLGILPGPEYQKIFAKVLTAKLNGQVNNRRKELTLIRKLVRPK